MPTSSRKRQTTHQRIGAMNTASAVEGENLRSLVSAARTTMAVTKETVGDAITLLDLVHAEIHRCLGALQFDGAHPLMHNLLRLQAELLAARHLCESIDTGNRAAVSGVDNVVCFPAQLDAGAHRRAGASAT